jgi:Tail tubular protein
MASTPLDLSTQLKAVNILLSGMGENPIESLEAGQSSLAQKAIDVLDETSRSLQAKGWYWNSEDNYPLSPDDAGEVPLPANAIRVARVWHSGGDLLVERGRKVYNRTDHTFVFPEGETVKVDIVLYLTWDELPEFAKHPIIYVAQKRLQMRELTSTAIDNAIEADVVMAMATLEQAEDAQGPANSITDSQDLAALSGNIRRR